MFATVEEAVEEIRQGRMVVIVDDEDRENEGDLTMAADKVTPEAINFMAKYGRGLICLPLTEQRCEELNLAMMSPLNTSNYGTAFCESIDARRGTTTGISAADRATQFWPPLTPTRAHLTWRGPVTSSRCARVPAGCWCARARRRLRWIWRASPD